jgi:hypothetical protein
MSGFGSRMVAPSEMRNTVRERTGISVELAEVTGREDAFGTCEAKLTSGIKEQALKRRDAIFHDLENAGPFYPREDVRAVLDYWGIQ